MSGQPKVFIIESLRFEDEKEDLFEGTPIRKMMRLSGSDPQYIYLRTRRELEEAVDMFEDADYRYLHFSCHGNKHGIDLTLDSLSFEELGKILRPILKGKRVFFSSCSVMYDKCASALLRDTGCFSVIGPSTKINFDRAAIFWASFYHLLLRDDATSMKHAQIATATKRLSSLFDVKMRYYRTSDSEAGFRREAL